MCISLIAAFNLSTAKAALLFHFKLRVIKFFP